MLQWSIDWSLSFHFWPILEFVFHKAAWSDGASGYHNLNSLKIPCWAKNKVFAPQHGLLGPVEIGLPDLTPILFPSAHHGPATLPSYGAFIYLDVIERKECEHY